LILIAISLVVSMFIIKREMFNFSKNIIYLDERASELNEKKESLLVELDYLTSPERILALVEKSDKILGDKSIVNVKQIKTKRELELALISER